MIAVLEAMTLDLWYVHALWIVALIVGGTTRRRSS